LYEDRTLLDARGKFQLGDLVWIGRKAVITKLTTTEGSKALEVSLRITRKWWSPEQLS
jgi:hypothetical protein